MSCYTVVCLFVLHNKNRRKKSGSKIKTSSGKQKLREIVTSRFSIKYL